MGPPKENGRQDRPRLTEEQKNVNHLRSEHKRRQNIRQAMEQLCEIIPGLEGKEAAEGEVLDKACTEIEKAIALNKKLCEERDRAGVPIPDYMRMYEGGRGYASGSKAPDGPRLGQPLEEWLQEAVEDRKGGPHKPNANGNGTEQAQASEALSSTGSAIDSSGNIGSSPDDNSGVSPS